MTYLPFTKGKGGDYHTLFIAVELNAITHIICLAQMLHHSWNLKYIHLLTKLYSFSEVSMLFSCYSRNLLQTMCKNELASV